MPIRPENRDRYPAEWPLISLWVRLSAGWRCEWCPAVQGEPHPVTGSRVVLTVAHVHDPAPERVEPSNLAALCQRCHLNHDRAQHRASRVATRRAAMLTCELLPTPSAMFHTGGTDLGSELAADPHSKLIWR